MTKSIKVSKKHGVNPTIPVCFWCGKEKNEIALLGALPGDKEAPMKAVINYEPCDECEKAISQGIHVIEVSADSNIQAPPISGGYRPTGRWMVMSKEYFSRSLEDNKELLDAILKNGRTLVPVEVFQSIQDSINELNKEE